MLESRYPGLCRKVEAGRDVYRRIDLSGAERGGILQPMSDTYLGLYRGIVEEGVDPAAHSRLRVSVPSVIGGDSRWAERSVSRPGAAAPLPPGTRVWVQFEDGNSDRPVVVGCVPGPDVPVGDAQRDPPTAVSRKRPN